ncbi:hypothetical protein [Vibrio europaeus]|uniref:hypothetical protein n=1 Tax=Vibrio europaeus TaxID=300876 RepID=UPI00233F1442|nr:hypothetical protein [Vibrio europaeus]MDC5753556.1 hypothetical protein [Vibrio europaeus]MDC5816532.1 hypothetical protein [Vibrio europaeus]
MKFTPEQIMEQLLEASKDETKAMSAMLVLLAHVNEYKIPEMLKALSEAGVLKIKQGGE